MPNYFVIYKGNSKKELIPEIIANAIWEAKSPTIRWKSKLGLRKIDLANVGNLYSEEEYYQNHPEERPIPETPKLPEYKQYNKVGSLKALSEIRKGLEKFINNNPEAKKSIEMHRKLNQMIEDIKSGKEKNFNINNIINI